MNTDKLPDHIVYSKKVIDFVTVVAETCLVLERASELEKSDFVEKMLKLLPLLYLNASIIDNPGNGYHDNLERFVTEEEYRFVLEQLEALLGEDDAYLEVFHPDMALSDTPIAAFVSENLADVYQELKDFAANYQLADIDIMNDSLILCLTTFGEHWGQKLLSALRALHAYRFSDRYTLSDDSELDTTTQNFNRNSFFNFQHEESKNDERLNIF